MIRSYTWEIHRQRHGLWTRQAAAGQPEDPYGSTLSHLEPDQFVRHIADTHPVDGPHRIVAWDTPGVGRHPVAILTNT